MSEQTVKVKTTRFGEFDVKVNSIIEVVGGLIGFPKFTRFVLLEYNPPFSWLHSVENADLAFVVVNGAEFGPNYDFPLPMGDPSIELRTEDEVAIMNIVSVRTSPQDTTVNLKAPVVVNMRNMRARQIILEDPNLSVRFPLWGTEGEKPAP